MSIPLKYNFGSLRVRWRSTLATALGVALVVAVFVMVMALARGLRQTYVSTGDARNLLVLRKGSTAESSSQISRDEARRIRYLPGIERSEDGQPLASPEIIVLILLDRLDHSGTAHVLLRGMGPMGVQLRPRITLSEGRMFHQGLQECVVSTKIARRFAHCRVGQQFTAGKFKWTVVGIFDADKTAYDSEVWVDADEARAAFNRHFYGSVLLRPVEDTAAAKELIRRAEHDKQLSVRILPEPEYYEDQTRTAEPIRYLGMFLAAIMSVGAAFSAMNTMYASVGARVREVGTLRVLGFRRRQIYVSFLLESMLIGLIGGVLGCLISLPLNGIATGTMSWTTFAEVAFEFRITAELLAKGLAFGIVMGVLGGLLPARMAARKPVLDALRAV